MERWRKREKAIKTLAVGKVNLIYDRIEIEIGQTQRYQSLQGILHNFCKGYKVQQNEFALFKMIIDHN